MIGSHNSMTYLPLKNWWLYPLNFMSKCQRVSIKNQYEKYNSRLFDLRIWFDNHNHPIFSHGLALYKGDVYKILEYLNSKSNCVVRILLEQSYDRNDRNLHYSNLFYQFCNFIELQYPNIEFFGGQRKYDRKSIYTFKPVLLNRFCEDYSSVVGSKLDDLWPWLYAVTHNKKSLEAHRKSGHNHPIMLDFIDIQ